MKIDQPTRSYYEEHALAVFERTLQVTLSDDWYTPFRSHIPTGGHILDAGCGSGRDSRYFLAHGYQVTAIDVSAELCRLATEYIGQAVHRIGFEEMDFQACFDGIWASHSLLHISRQNFPDVLGRMEQALKPGGVLYATFFYGNVETRRGGLLFNDFDEASFPPFLETCPALSLVKMWQSPEAPPTRPDKIVFHVLVKKNSN